jgi:hypothetical protein
MKRAPIIKIRNINDTRLLINGPELYRVVIAYQRYCPNRHPPQISPQDRIWTGRFN